MKKTFTVIALTVLVWSCAKKSTPTASTGGTSSNTGSVVNAPAANTGTVATTANANPAAGAVVPSTPEGTRSPADANVTKSPEMLGQSTFNTKCGRCHGLKVTTDYTVDRWISVMQVMAQKANLSDTEKENVLAYVKANAKK